MESEQPLLHPPELSTESEAGDGIKTSPLVPETVRVSLKILEMNRSERFGIFEGRSCTQNEGGGVITEAHFLALLAERCTASPDSDPRRTTKTQICK